MSGRSFFYQTNDTPSKKEVLFPLHANGEGFVQERFMNTQIAESLRDFAEESSLGLLGLESRAVFEQLEQRYKDLLSAMQWFINQERTDDALRLATSLAQFWMATKRLEDGTEWFDHALNAPSGQDINRGEAFFQAALLAFWQGDNDRASMLHNNSLDIGHQAGDATIIAEALSGLARIALRSDLGEARRLCREALAVTEGTVDQRGRSNAMHVLGVAAQMAGDFHEARELMSARIAHARALGNFRVISSEAGNLSMVERQLGNVDQAEMLACEALKIDYQRGDHWAMPYKVSGLAAVSTERREYERAATLVGVANAMMEAEKAGWPPDERPHYEWVVATLKSAMGAAGFEQARATGHAMTISEAVDFALGTHPAG
jgi:tetratricopeptide (TPR) repeat protein